MLTPIVRTRMEDTTVPTKPAATEQELSVRILTNAVLPIHTTAMKWPRVQILRPVSTALVTQVLVLSCKFNSL